MISRRSVISAAIGVGTVAGLAGAASLVKPQHRAAPGAALSAVTPCTISLPGGARAITYDATRHRLWILNRSTWYAKVTLHSVDATTFAVQSEQKIGSPDTWTNGCLQIVGDIIVAAWGFEVLKLDARNGELLARRTLRFSNNSSRIDSIAVGGDGIVYVAASEEPRVHRLDPDLAPLEPVALPPGQTFRGSSGKVGVIGRTIVTNSAPPGEVHVATELVTLGFEWTISRTSRNETVAASSKGLVVGEALARPPFDAAAPFTVSDSTRAWLDPIAGLGDGVASVGYFGPSIDIRWTPLSGGPAVASPFPVFLEYDPKKLAGIGHGFPVKTPLRFDPRIQDIASDGSKTIWIATDGGYVDGMTGGYSPIYRCILG